MRFNQLDNYGGAAAAYLPTVVVSGMDDPVVQVEHEPSREIVYTLRVNGTEFRPPVLDRTASYTVRVGEPGTDAWESHAGVTVSDDGGVLEVVFQP